MNSSLYHLGKLTKQLRDSSDNCRGFIESVLTGDVDIRATIPVLGKIAQSDYGELTINDQVINLTTLQDGDFATVSGIIDQATGEEVPLGTILSEIESRGQTQSVLASISGMFTANSRLAFTNIQPMLMQISDQQSRDEITSMIATIANTNGYVSQTAYMQAIASYMQAGLSTLNESSLDFPTRQAYIIQSVVCYCLDTLISTVAAITSSLASIVSPILAGILAAVGYMARTLFSLPADASKVEVNSDAGNYLMVDPTLTLNITEDLSFVDQTKMLVHPCAYTYVWPNGNVRRCATFIDLQFNWCYFLQIVSSQISYTFDETGAYMTLSPDKANKILNYLQHPELFDQSKLYMSESEMADILSDDDKLHKHICMLYHLSNLWYLNVLDNGFTARYSGVTSSNIDSIDKMVVGLCPYDTSVSGLDQLKRAWVIVNNLLGYAGAMKNNDIIISLDSTAFGFNVNFDDVMEKYSQVYKTFDQYQISGWLGSFVPQTTDESSSNYLHLFNGASCVFSIAPFTGRNIEAEMNSTYVTSYPAVRCVSLPKVSKRAITIALIAGVTILTTAAVSSILIKRWWSRKSLTTQIKAKNKLAQAYKELEANPDSKEAYAKYKKAKFSYDGWRKLFGFESYDPINDWFESSVQASEPNTPPEVDLSPVISLIRK